MEEAPVQFLDSDFTDMGYAGRLKRAILHRWNKPSVRTKNDYEREVTIEFKIRPKRPNHWRRSQEFIRLASAGRLRPRGHRIAGDI